MLHLVLYQPEIPHNMGALTRFVACMGMVLDVIEPCGFLFSDKHLKRTGMDYGELAFVNRFMNWETFCHAYPNQRRIAIAPRFSEGFTSFSFQKDDLLIMGQESDGLPLKIMEDCHATVSIPMKTGARSLNLSLCAAMVATEALRQTHQLP